MLGEDHSLVLDFPELKDTILRLNQIDPEFCNKNKRYTALDKEIRKLELCNSPIDDESMHQLKLDRAKLKDLLYTKVREADA